MAVTDRIEIDPKVMMGKPVIRGTRYAADTLAHEETIIVTPQT